MALGCAAAGIAPLRPSEHAHFYRAWLAQGRHGAMGWLARPDAVARRTDPTRAWPVLKSALVIAVSYQPTAEEATPDRAHGIIARYARGRDYHRVVKAKLLRLLRWLERETGEALPAARAYVDTGAVLERELAGRAGLGWFGRNTMLIHPRRGSYFFLGVLLLELELPADAPFTRDHCGTCNACVEACPTGALLGRDSSGAPIMDARRCISYLTIEQRGPIPRELRPLISNRVFGCDICQEVCPFNRRQAAALDAAFAARGPGEAPGGSEPAGTARAEHPGTATPALVELMAMDEAAWEDFSRGSAIRRAGHTGFRRNVAVALGNWGAAAAAPSLIAALADAEPLVRSHAAWALGKVGTATARTALNERLSCETDPAVIEEIHVALSDCDVAAPSQGTPAG